MAAVDNEGLVGRGIVWIDAHLLASARLSSCGLPTSDRRLGAIAKLLGLPSA